MQIMEGQLWHISKKNIKKSYENSEIIIKYQKAQYQENLQLQSQYPKKEVRGILQKDDM